MTVSVFEDKIMLENTETATFGLIIEDDNGNAIRRIYDAALDGKALNRLAERINRDDVEPVSLDGILEDFYLSDC